MSKVIHKIVLDPSEIDYKLPLGAKVLYASSQRMDVCVWYETDVNQSLVENHQFRVYGTGHGLSEDIDEYQNIGIAKLMDDQLILHVYHKKG